MTVLSYMSSGALSAALSECPTAPNTLGYFREAAQDAVLHLKQDLTAFPF
jgi:hypothetical protein